MLMSLTFVTARGCAGACGLGYHLVSSLVSKGCTATRVIPIWVAFTATWGHVDNLAQVAAKDHVWVHGPAAAGVYVDVPSPCWCQRSCRCLSPGWRGNGSGPQLVTMLVSKGCITTLPTRPIWVTRADN